MMGLKTGQNGKRHGNRWTQRTATHAPATSRYKKGVAKSGRWMVPPPV